MWTTPTELVKVGLALSRSYRRGGFLRKKTARRMLTPAIEGETYGLCVQNLRGDVGYHGGWNEGFLTEWFFSLREDLCVGRGGGGGTEKLDWKQTETAVRLFQTVEADMADMPGARTLRSYCGKYEQNVEDFRLEEVYTEDGKLYAKVVGEDGAEAFKLYPIGKKTFGREGGFAKIVFGDDCLSINGTVCKKL